MANKRRRRRDERPAAGDAQALQASEHPLPDTVVRAAENRPEEMALPRETISADESAVVNEPQQTSPLTIERGTTMEARETSTDALEGVVNNAGTAVKDSVVGSLKGITAIEAEALHKLKRKRFIPSSKPRQGR